MRDSHRYRRARVLSRAAASLVAGAALLASAGVAAPSAPVGPTAAELEVVNAALSRSVATQGMVLLENADGALPMAAAGNVAVFGVGSYRTIKGGTGSGDVNNRYTVTVLDGLGDAGYSITTSPEYADAVQAAYDAKYPPGSTDTFLGPVTDYSSVEQTLTATSVLPTAATDTALFVVARKSGEGTDRVHGPGDYLLTDVESHNLRLLGQTYPKVAVVLNVGGIVDTNFFDRINGEVRDPTGGPALDALLLASQAGQETGTAIVQVLDGTVVPSGKLTDTWAAEYSSYPASATIANNDGNPVEEQYREGIYVGYRYFDSYYGSIDPADPERVVRYPFGYGLSYTSFSIAVHDVRADADSITVTARVTNTGTEHAGREVVQVYFSAPRTGLDKPYQELAGYAKTDELAPGASQMTTIRFNTRDMASYDSAKAAYTLEPGDYVIRVGDSSRSTSVAAVVRLDGMVTTQQLTNEEDDRTVDTELRSDPADFYSYPTEAEEVAAAPRLDLRSRGFATADDASEFDQDVAVDAASPYRAIDGDSISTIEAYVPTGTTDWEGTGAPYRAKAGESIADVSTDPGRTLFDVHRGAYSLEQFVAGLSVTQLANIVEGALPGGTTARAIGAAGYSTAGYEAMGLPGMTLADGPAGLRITQQVDSVPPAHQFATAWPIGTLLAQTWDRDLVERVGAAISEEMTEYGVTLWLAPGMNIHRDPLNGRNFEYYSEDPLVSGLTAAAMTDGVQSAPGVGVTLKHLFANNQETERDTTNAIISERATREIYLKGFEIAVKSAQPMAVMTSYNRINDTYASGSYDLATDILRGEWGFEGLVMTDWEAGPLTGAAGVLYSGNDLIEPGQNAEEVVAAITRVEPTIDVTGMPAHNFHQAWAISKWTWSFGSLVPSATGTVSVSTVVDGSVAGAPRNSVSTVRDARNDDTVVPAPPFATVQAAYDDVQALLASSVLTDAQKAGITVSDVLHETPGDAATPVVSYTVTLRGDHPTEHLLRLGDLQRSAMKVITVAMRSSGFAELAAAEGVDGVEVGAYTDRFHDLPSYLDAATGPIEQHRETELTLPVDPWG